MSDNATDHSGDYPKTDTPLLESRDALDTLFGLLANQRRRYALECLTEFDEPLALADLADEVAEREHDDALTEIPAEVVKRTYISLYHTHLPKLEAADVVRYDQERDAVTLAVGSERLEQFEEFLEVG